MSHAWGKVMLVDLPSGLAWQLGIDENQQYMEVGLDVRIITIWRSILFGDRLMPRFIWLAIQPFLFNLRLS
jgi:hypothetical protein